DRARHDGAVPPARGAARGRAPVQGRPRPDARAGSTVVTRARRIRLRWLGPMVALLGLVLGACGEAIPSTSDVAEGDPRVGAQLIGSMGCGSCHRVPGVDEAEGLVGPPLDAFGDRAFIAGELENSPENLVRWIMSPQEVNPGGGMPDM